MQNIITHLWFDHQAEEAARFYTSLFSGGKMGRIYRFGRAVAERSGQPEGRVMAAHFELCGQQFVGLNGGDVFKFTPATSLTVYCETEAEIEGLWNKLSEGGRVMMELGEYPWSKKFGFLQDKYGLAWQLNLVICKQAIVPSLLFVDSKYGRAEEAMRKYVSIFDGKIQMASPNEDGSLLHGIFNLRGQDFIAMDGAGKHAFDFTGAVSFLVKCKDQAEVDRLWRELGEDGVEMPCGWIADKYGVCWQVVPAELLEMLQDKDTARAERVTEVMLTMKRLELEKLRRAFQT